MAQCIAAANAACTPLDLRRKEHCERLVTAIDERVGTSFLEAVATHKLGGLVKEATVEEKRKEKRRIAGSFKAKEEELKHEKNVHVLLATRQSKSRWEQARLMENFETQSEKRIRYAETPPTKKLHVPVVPRFNPETAREVLDEWPIARAINWSEAARQVKAFN